MSHLRERKEKDCLNCGATVHGRYCHVCGQENIEPKESFWHLVTHFVYDVTHFDGKFFSTLKYLLFKPGFLSKEYLVGRRASYLHPIKMYVFTSAFFFLIFFSVNKSEPVKIQTTKPVLAEKQMKSLLKNRKRAERILNDSSMSELGKGPTRKWLAQVDTDIARLKADTMYKTKLISIGTEQKDFSSFFTFMGNKQLAGLKTVASYDSLQERLPAGQRDGWIKRGINRQTLHLNETYNGDTQKIGEVVVDKFKHLVPQMLFVSLPLFALMMQLLYVRRKSYYYVNHVVFTIHLYCGTFIIILAAMLMSYIGKKVHYTGGWDEIILTLASLFFTYKSIRNFYQQGRAKTILKCILIFLISLVFMTILFVLFFIFSAMAV